MNTYLRERIARKLDTLSDERLYQVLDFVEFLEARYAEKPASPVSAFQRFAESVEDRLRAGGVAVTTVSETMGLLNRAVGVLNTAAQSAMTVGREVMTAVGTTEGTGSAPATAQTPSTTAPTATPPSQPPSPSAPPPGTTT